ncbi:riboflavin synthase [Aeromicrobium duanguangcaii]|uniref:Riboflavin synthase n=1 Tax=Aeromicrobium duanguangcaii TaxID=2968086 RepID=A0ABY5KHU6_9ACTN|nr:riboflavin synthase [Aeromicrobium duanguangcaii]MCD9152990.1 riboflavin synthase [Aeromicrobium duanguangcaii]UUI69905.1 riboflavin synthase [Aeromicrobium duanguangcaii]
MFTGLVEEKGTVVSLDDLGDSVRITIRGPVVTSDAAHGDSIAVNGCCLTVVDPTDDTFSADVMRESLDRTSLGDLTEGAEVNLERAMQAGARMGGHIVQGHVDGTATLLARTPSEHWEVVRFSLPSELARYVVDKGSITVDGTSLTVVEAGDDWFSVSLIPTTLADTVLGTRQPGDRVNLEVDVIAKYVERLLEKGAHA